MQKKEDILRILTGLLADARSGESPATRALVVEGDMGVGKSHVLHEALDIARKLGIHAVGPINGRDMSVGMARWQLSSQEPELIGRGHLPANDADVPLLAPLTMPTWPTPTGSGWRCGGCRGDTGCPAYG